MEFRSITVEDVTALLNSNPGLKQPQLLELLYPGDPGLDERGDPIKRPHLELESILTAMASDGRAQFTPKGKLGGWHLR